MIKVINLFKRFDKLEVLKGINLEIKEGETFVIIGQSGSGKSVFLKLLIGLLKPEQGEIYIDGIDITKLEEKQIYKIRMKFGVVFQYSALFDSLNVYENIAFGLIQHTNLDEKLIEERVGKCLSLVGLEGIESRIPAELSGGMKKRVAIARAIALNPRIIFYDEPTAGLDPVVASAINSLINKLKKEVKATSVVVTHDMKSAYSIADRIGMLYQGVIVQIGTSEEIRNSNNSVVRQFVDGEPEGSIEI